jgi:hypothetical protein
VHVPTIGGEPVTRDGGEERLHIEVLDPGTPHLRLPESDVDEMVTGSLAKHNAEHPLAVLRASLEEASPILPRELGETSQVIEIDRFA